MAAAVGLAFSSARPLGMSLNVLMPALAMRRRTRLAAYGMAICYYAGALWPLIVGARNFFGTSVSVLTALTLWLVACVLLALPWMAVWSLRTQQLWWRAAFGVAISAIPPLGIIGWASPLTAAGLLFPGTHWWGLAACAIAPGLIAAWPRYAGPLVVIAAAVCNLLRIPVPLPPAGWKAVNTRFARIAHGTADPLAEYAAAQSIQRTALATNAAVLLFPETVVPIWTTATDEFWQPTIQCLRTERKTIIVGARLPVPGGVPPVPSIGDYIATINVLRGGSVPGRKSPGSAAVFEYDNAVVIRGGATTVFRQRIPVPVAMWKPFGRGGARLHLFGPGVLRFGNQRAAVLICYEQLIVWPIIVSLYERPDIFLGVANDQWATGTVIPEHQEANMDAWSRLFGLPCLSAVNF